MKDTTHRKEGRKNETILLGARGGDDTYEIKHYGTTTSTKKTSVVECRVIVVVPLITYHLTRLLLEVFCSLDPVVVLRFSVIINK